MYGLGGGGKNWTEKLLEFCEENSLVISNFKQIDSITNMWGIYNGVWVTSYVTRSLKLRGFSKNSILRYGLKCKLIGSLVKSGFRVKTIHKHLIFHITNLQLWECIAKGVYLAVL